MWSTSRLTILPCAAAIMWTSTLPDVINISAFATSARVHKSSASMTGKRLWHLHRVIFIHNSGQLSDPVCMKEVVQSAKLHTRGGFWTCSWLTCTRSWKTWLLFIYMMSLNCDSSEYHCVCFSLMACQEQREFYLVFIPLKSGRDAFRDIINGFIACSAS